MQIGGKVLALHQLHDQIRATVAKLVAVDDTDDVVILEGRQDLAFALKALQKQPAILVI